jgi:DNA-binding LacI/PurR family transcriptional regulator
MNVNQQKNKVGVREVAELAKVSVATVSRVLNGSSNVDPSTQRIVLDAAAKLDIDVFQRNKTKALAFLLGNRAMLHPFHSRILLGAEAHCAAYGWDMVFLSFNYSPQVSWKELHLPKVIQRRDTVRAMILAGTNSTNLFELLDHKGITFAVLGNTVVGDLEVLKDQDAVFSDDVQGGNDMTRYLIGLGHRNIGFVGNVRLPRFARSFAGYRRAMDEANLPQRLNSPGSEDDAEIGYIGAKSLLTQDNSVTAILAGNDRTAHGIYKALRDCGLRVPADISVAGCDDTVGQWLHPSLTTNREFPEQVGQQLVELVLNRIAKHDLPPQHVTLPTEFVKRDSCRSIPVLKETAADASLYEVNTAQ